MNYPRIYRIKQRFNTLKIHDIEREILEQLNLININSRIKLGMKIAVTAGSRGISNIASIIKTVCNVLKNYGAEPFIVPAMGSHGGATAEGQKNVLKKLGITEETMDVPIVSSMDVVEIGRTPNDIPVYMDKNAYNADGIVVINRVKPHTDFSGEIESGLMKMIAVGLGKAKGAVTMHSNGISKAILEAARVALEKAPIMFGLAILENSCDDTYMLKAVLPEAFEKEEKNLLKESKTIVPKIPADYLDALIVYEMGKMFSGTGMDTKVIGRMKIFGEMEPETPKINKIAVLNLSDSSYGNALGVGLADITTRKLVDKINYDITYANTIPTTYLERAKIPVISKDDRSAIELALKTIGNVKPEEAKLAIVKNTLSLEELYVSESLLKDINSNKYELIDENCIISFDNNGNLILDWE
ncbi:lactate racemase domain-containing protein [Fonticella tunisiensis]|uniref:Uncharacterized protein DUF2088 n=1 Tax=Fonticella tunisiensis TaxID=1096341 RepID=A0A4R7KSU6_9CLOT|nr:lactate racemase domain-containing protein [Fonticella tunisiensis]TDT61905.1 uncharacterized protein DUF2088 [Fonticella tunisiensis]